MKQVKDIFFLVYMNEDVNNKQLRAYFKIRNIRSKALSNVLPNYKTLTSTQIYRQLKTIYIRENTRYQASFSGLIFTSLTTKGNVFQAEPISIPNKTVKSLNEYIQYVYDILLDELYKTNYTIYRIRINGVTYLIREQKEKISYIDLTDFNTALPFLTQYITMTQLPNTIPKVTPILNRNAPKLEFCTNTPTTYNKLCGIVELIEITGGKKRNATTVPELLHVFVKLCSHCELYKTDNNGDFIYDRLQPIQVEVTVKNIMENGITTEMLMTVCNELKVKINLFTHDDTGQVKRETNSGEISHQGGKTLNLIVENNHTYVLTDINQVRRFNGKIQKTASSSSRKKGKGGKKPTNYILNDQQLAPQDFLLQQDCLPSKVRLQNGVLNHFCIGPTKYILNIDEEAREHYGKDFIGQTATEIASQYIQPIPQSTMTGYIYKALTLPNVKHRTHTDVLHPEYFTDGLPNHEGIKKYDINKAYTYSMKALQSLYTLDITQSIQVCPTLNGAGLYFVEAPDQLLLHGTNWYSYEILVKAKEIRENYSIKYKLNVVENENPFPTILETIDNDISTPSFKKKVKNVLSGFCGITQQKYTTAQVTTSQNKIVKFLDHNEEPFVKTLGTLFFYGMNVCSQRYTNRLLTYIQILDQFNILCYDRSTGTGGLILARHIDAFYVLNPTNTDHFSIIEGDYKYEEYKKLTFPCRDRNVVFQSTPLPKKGKLGFLRETTQGCIIKKRWNTLTLQAVKNGLMVTGMAGTGKTYAIKKLMEGKKVQFIAPTNKAALLLGGVTIHKFLHISQDTNEATYPKLDLEYLVMDEASMITSDLWLHLYEFKRVNPTISYIILGDTHQLPSIETAKYSFETTDAILGMVNYNLLELTKNYRQDEEGLTFCKDILSGTPYNLQPSNQEPHAEDTHLCYFNKTRQKLNQRFNIKTDRSIQVKLNDIWIDYIDHKEVELELFGYLHQGVKIICNKRYDTIANSQIGRIVGANTETLCLKMEDDNQIEITHQDFTKHFTLGYALTIHKAQGQTYSNIVNIYDVKALQKECYKYLYTAVSRATQFNHIHFQYEKSMMDHYADHYILT